MRWVEPVFWHVMALLWMFLCLAQYITQGELETASCAMFLCNTALARFTFWEATR